VIGRLRAFDHVGFFLARASARTVEQDLQAAAAGDGGVIQMLKANPTMAQRIAEAASAFQKERTGYAPESVTVVLTGDTLVVTLHGALTKAEKTLARSAAGATQVQEFHRQLFSNSSESLKQEIQKITGVEVRESTAEVETATGAVVHAFTTGTMVQVFLLAQKVAEGQWPEKGSDDLLATTGATV
jgi:uncharacterized protein YbcI